MNATATRTAPPLPRPALSPSASEYREPPTCRAIPPGAPTLEELMAMPGFIGEGEKQSAWARYTYAELIRQGAPDSLCDRFAREWNLITAPPGDSTRPAATYAQPSLLEDDE